MLCDKLFHLIKNYLKKCSFISQANASRFHIRALRSRTIYYEWKCKFLLLRKITESAASRKLFIHRRTLLCSVVALSSTRSVVLRLRSRPLVSFWLKSVDCLLIKFDCFWWTLRKSLKCDEKLKKAEVTLNWLESLTWYLRRFRLRESPVE